MKKLNRLEAALLCAELACLAYPAVAAADSQIYNQNIETTDAVTVEIDATASGAVFAESSSGRYAGIGAYITDDWTDDNSLPGYTITANGITITGATSEAYRLYGLAAYYASLNVDSSVGITLSLSGDSTGQLRAIRNNYYGTITLGGDVTAKLTNASSSSSSATYGFDNWGYATTVNGDVDMELSSEYTPIFGIYSQGSSAYAPATVFNKDFTLTITAGENNASEVDGVYGYISTIEFNGDTTITIEDKYSGDVTSYANSVFLNCDNNEYATVISFNGDSTSLTSTTVAKDNYGVTASGPTGSISFTGKTVTVSSSSDSGLALGLDAQYGATISVSENTALTVAAASTSGDAMAVIADCYYGNGSIAIAGTASLTASSDSGYAFGVYNYGEENDNTGSGSVTLTGDAEITAASGSGYAFGVYAYGDAVTALSGETITITATADDGVSYGVYAGGGADVAVGASESSVAVAADCAIYADAATVTLTASEMALEGDVYAGAEGVITLTANAAELDGSLYAYGGTITVDADELTFGDDACIEVASVTDEESSQSYDGNVSVTTDSDVSNITITGNVVATESGFTVTSADAAIAEGTAITFAGGVSVTGTIAGDAVTVAGADNSAASITFNSLTFDLTDMEADAVMLTVADAVDLDGLSVGVENADASELAPGDALTLLSDEKGISNLDNATVTTDGTLGYTLSGLSDAYLEGTFGYSIYLDEAATSLIFSAGTDISVTDLILASFSDASEQEAAAAALSLDWGSGALLTLENGLTYDFSAANLEAADSVTISGVSSTLLAAGDSYQLVDGTEATVTGLASLTAGSDNSEAGSLSTAYSYEPATGVTVTGTALYVGTDTDESTAGSLALSVSSVDAITFGTITYSDEALITLDTDKTYDLAATSIDVSKLTVVDSEGSPVSVTYDDAEITDGGTVYMTLIDASVDTGLSVEDGTTSQSFGYTLTNEENSLTGTMAGVVTVNNYDLVLAAESAVTVSELTLDTSSLEWGADALLTLNDSLTYDFSDSSLDVSDSVAITGVSGTLLAASDSMTLLEAGSASVSGLASLISDASATYSYEPASGVTVAGSAVYVGTDTGSDSADAGLALSVSSIDAITFGTITYSDSALITLDADKTYDLSETSVDVENLTVVDSEGSPVSVTYDDAEITDSGTVYMTLIDASEATGLSLEEETSLSFGYTLTNEENSLTGTMAGVVTVNDYDLVLAAASSVAVSELTLDTSSLEWGADALLTLNDSLAYDFTSASVSGLDDASIATGSFLDVDASTTLVDAASATVSGLSALEGLGGTYSYSLLDGVVTVTGSGSLTVSSGNVDYTISSIDTMDFYITSDTASGSTILTVATADLSGTAVTAYAEGGSYLTAGYEVTLLTAEDGLTTDDSTTYTATITEGVSVEYDVDVYQDGDSIVAVVAGDETEDDGSDTDADTGSDEDSGSDTDADTDTDTGSDEDGGAASGSSSGSSLRSETKSLVETRLAQLAMLEQGADLLTNATSDRTTLAESLEGWAPFAAVSRASYKYATGSYVDIDGFNATVGVMKTDATPYGSLTYGAAFQYGSGEYDSHAEGVKARGDTEYKGGSLFIRSAWNSGSYLELSLSRGTTEGDYKSSEILDGVNCSYKDDAPYWGASLGVGRELDLGGAKALDVYARYFYSHINDSSVRLSTGETYDFDSTDSSRLRLGARYTRDLNRNSRYYAGLAYEYQFDGAARASYNGMSTLSPSLEGSSGMLEAGVLFAPDKGNLTVDLGVTGWAGTRKGVEGRLMFNISF